MIAAAPFPIRTLPRAGVAVSVLGFGGATIGTLHGPVDEDEARATLAAAWTGGIRYFDTAPLYGAGLGERRVGGFLGTAQRDAYIVSTKTGWIVNAAGDGCRCDYSADGTLASFEASLARLGLEQIDIAFIHDLDSYNHGPALPLRFEEAMRGAYPMLERLRREGRVRAIGIGVNDPEICLRALGHGDFDVFLMAGKYTLLDQGAFDRLLPACVSSGARVIVGAPFNTGILATGARAGARFAHKPADPALLQKVARIEAVAKSFGVPLAAAALQFPLGHKAILSILPGARRPGQIAACVDAMRVAIPARFWSTLKGEGLLPEDVPTPAR